LFVVDARNPHQATRKIPVPVRHVTFAEINENATLLAVAWQTGPNDTQNGVELWDVRELRKPVKVQPFFEPVGATCVAFGPDGRLALGYHGGRVVIWNVNTRKMIQELASPITMISWLPGRYPAVESIAFSPDGKRLASSSPHRPLNLWDVDTGTLIWSLERSGTKDYERDLLFSRDGKKLFSTVERVTKVWDVDPNSWAERALRLASRTPGPVKPLPVAPIAGLAEAQGR